MWHFRCLLGDVKGQVSVGRPLACENLFFMGLERHKEEKKCKGNEHVVQKTKKKGSDLM